MIDLHAAIAFCCRFCFAQALKNLFASMRSSSTHGSQ
jgi:hypothetical protein